MSKAKSPQAILSLTQWETRIADFYSSTRSFRLTSAEMQERRQTYILSELSRKHGKRAVYSAYVAGYVAGLEAAHRAEMYRFHLEYCFCVDGVLYSTHRDSTHRKTEEFYARGEGHILGNAPVHGHYWKGTDKPYFLGTGSRT